MAALAGATVALDLDGTLVDTAPDLVASVNAALAHHDMATLPFDIARAAIGRGAKGMLALGFERADVDDPVRLETAFDYFLEHYTEYLCHGSSAYAGAMQALGRMREAGAKLVVCTNKTTGLSVRLLAQLKMIDLVDAVVGADSVPAPKPDGGHLSAAITAVGGDIRRSVMVGDSAPDVAAARALEVPIVLVDFGYSETPAHAFSPDALISGLFALPEACDQVLGDRGVLQR